MRRFPLPEPGDIVFCRFPQVGALRPGPKSRPALVLQVGFVEAEPYVHVAYGTSRKTDELYPGEFLMSPEDGQAFAASGLSLSTKFDLGKSVDLPYNETWFSVPPNARHGQTPGIGLLHPGLMRRAQAAFRAARAR